MFSSCGQESFSFHYTVSRVVCLVCKKVGVAAAAAWNSRNVYFAYLRETPPESFDSSVGRAVDCSGVLKSIGRWFESGSKDKIFFFSHYFWCTIIISPYSFSLALITT